MTPDEYKRLTKKPKRSKFGNKKVEFEGRVYHSQAELAHFMELRFLERAKKIHSLTCQPKFPIVLNGIKIADVIADFSFFENGQFVVVDVKGLWTAVSRIKWKLACAIFPEFDWRIIKSGGKRGR